MRVRQANELFRSLTQSYFVKAEVVFANQSRKAKPQIPLVTVKPGNVKRSTFANSSIVGDTNVSQYPSRISYTVDLFTNGEPICDDDGNAIAYENTAMDEMQCFIDFLNSDYALDWCRQNDVSILIEGEAQDLTGIVNDTNYEYRSRLMVLFYFTQTTVGSAAVFEEQSIQYPVYETDPDTGEVVRDEETDEPVIKTDPVTKEPIYTTEEPKPTTSTTGSFTDVAEEQIEEAVVVPIVIDTSAGSGTPEIAETAEIGYFDKVEIKEDLSNE